MNMALGGANFKHGPFAFERLRLAVAFPIMKFETAPLGTRTNRAFRSFKAEKEMQKKLSL